MAQLHLHVISQDLRGGGMKHRKHWNSFVTDFFRDASEVLRDLRALGGGDVWYAHAHVRVFARLMYGGGITEVKNGCLLRVVRGALKKNRRVKANFKM